MDKQRVEQALKEILEVKGQEIVQNHGAFKAAVFDLLDEIHYRDERLVLKHAMDANAFWTLLGSGSPTADGAKRAAEQLVKESRMTKEDAEFVVRCVAAARNCRISSPNRQNPSLESEACGLQRDKRIVVCGENNSGKATLINALIRSRIMFTTHYPKLPIPMVLMSDDEDKVVHVRKINKNSPLTIKEWKSLEDMYGELWNGQGRETIEKMRLEEHNTAVIHSCNISRKVTISYAPYLKYAEDIINPHAIVFVKRAETPFGMEEKDYIHRHFEERQMQNLFFAVTHIDAYRASERETVKANISKYLTDVFKDKYGYVDDTLCKKRIFCMNAALSARIRQGMESSLKESSVSDEETGVPEFERVLCDWLGIQHVYGRERISRVHNCKMFQND